MTKLQSKSKNNCCINTSIIFASLLLLVGIIILLAGFLRLALVNQTYQPTECTVTTKEVREITGICVAGKCSPSKYEGRVEFQLSDKREIWSTVISSYDKQQVNNFMAAHFTLNQETECYINQNNEILFQLNSTGALLAASIILIILSLFTFLMVIVCACRKRKSGYIDLDKNNGVGL